MTLEMSTFFVSTRNRTAGREMDLPGREGEIVNRREGRYYIGGMVTKIEEGRR